MLLPFVNRPPAAPTPVGPSAQLLALLQPWHPGPFALSGLAVTWLLRVAAWLACHVLWVSQGRDLIKGLSWDLALVSAVFVGVRLAHRSKGLLGRWTVRILALVVAISVVIRILDLGHCLMVGSHWTTDAFLYLDQGFACSFKDIRLIAAVGLALLLALGAGWSVLADAQRLGRNNLQPLPHFAAIALLPALWAMADGVRYPAYATQARLIPEVNFALRAMWFYQDGASVAQVPQLSRELQDAFTVWGILDGQSADRQWPLLRNTFHSRPFPLPRRAGAVDRPNVVLTLLESTNALFIYGMSGRYQGLMPEISALSQRMAIADEFYNTSSPTIAAMVASLCSVHPPAHPRDLQPGTTVSGRAAYTCLGDLLRQVGYRTVFVQAAAKNMTGKEFFLKTHGFDDVYGRDDLLAFAPNATSGTWGPHDSVLVDFTEHLIERLERQRQSDGRPYFLVMLTLDSHEPGMAPADCTLPRDAQGLDLVKDLPADAAGRRLLTGYHCSDRAIGQLGHFLLDSPRSDQTMWLVTADHAAFPDLVPASVYVDPAAAHASARIPLLIHDPLHELPAHIATLGGTQDLAPTLIDLLEMPDAPNSLTGLSLFDERQQHPLLVGRIGERLALARAPGESVELPLAQLHELCQDHRVLIRGIAPQLTACDLEGWLHWQDGLWAAHRLFPANLYQGSHGVDGDVLLQYQQSGAEGATTVQPAQPTRPSQPSPYRTISHNGAALQ